MNIQSTIRTTPALRTTLAAGSLESPSVLLRTPSGNHDLLLSQNADRDPSLRRLLCPIKNLAMAAATQVAPNISGVLEGVSAMIDLTVDLASDIQESQVSVSQPVDGTDQLARLLNQTDSEDEQTRREELRSIFGDPRKPEGIVSFVASFKDHRTFETKCPIEHVLSESPLLLDLFQIGDGIVQLLDSNRPSSPLDCTPVNAKLMDELREALSTPEKHKAA